MIRPTVPGVESPEGDRTDQMPERFSLIGKSFSHSEEAFVDPALR